MQQADIIAAAARLFIEKGFQATTMKDVAAACGLREVSLYRQVTSKQEILFMILDQEMDRLSNDIYTIANSELRPEEKLRLAIQIYVDYLSEDTGMAGLVVMDFRQLEPRLRERHIARRDRFEHIWRKILQEGISTGEFRPVDVSVTAFAILGLQNWMLTWYQEGGRLRVHELADRFADFILNGIQDER